MVNFFLLYRCYKVTIFTMIKVEGDGGGGEAVCKSQGHEFAAMQKPPGVQVAWLILKMLRKSWITLNP